MNHHTLPLVVAVLAGPASAQTFNIQLGDLKGLVAETYVAPGRAGGHRGRGVALQAVVLAGGRGTRLSTAPEALPKPLVPLAGAPVLDHVIGRLVAAGVTDVVLCTGYRAELFEETLGDGARYGIALRYSVETSPLGTAGARLLVMRLMEAEKARARVRAEAHERGRASRG